jgi:hypothetical protein
MRAYEVRTQPACCDIHGSAFSAEDVATPDSDAGLVQQCSRIKDLLWFPPFFTFFSAIRRLTSLTLYILTQARCLPCFILSFQITFLPHTPCALSSWCLLWLS